MPTAMQRLFGRTLLNVVAVHSKGRNLSADQIESWYRQTIAWMQGMGHEPKSVAFLGVKGFEDATSYSFAHANKKLCHRGFADIPSLSLEVATPPGSIWWTCREPIITASLSIIGRPPIGGYLAWGWENDKKKLSPEVFLGLADQANRLGMLDYAQAFQHDSCLLPLADATLDPFMRRTGKTGGMGYPTKRAYESGLHPLDFLREIYPYQILAPVHLSYRVGLIWSGHDWHRIESQTLGEWIASSEAHGTLEQFSEQRWLWIIPETQLQSVRGTLAANNLLTLYLPDMSRILDYYGKSSD